MIVFKIILGIYLALNPYLLAETRNMILVEGIAQTDQRYQLDFKNKYSPIPLPITKIMAIKGKVKAKKLSSKIFIEELRQKKINTITNDKGEFSFKLNPGVYTFFILKEDEGYLNRFDGYGYFKSTIVEKPIKNLILIDDEKGIY